MSDLIRQTAGRIVNLGLGVLVTVLVVRLLGDERFGQWATLLAMAGIANQLADFGMKQVAVRYAATDPAREADWLGGLLRVNGLITLAVVPLLFVAIALTANTEAMLVAGAVLLLSLVLRIPATLGAVFQLRVRNDIAVAITTANNLVWTAAVAALFLVGGGLLAVAIALVCAELVSTALTVALALRRVRPSLRGVGAHARRLFGVGAPAGVASLVIVAYAKVDHVLVFELAGARAAGLYGVVYRVLEQAAFVPVALSATLLPMMSAAYVADSARLHRLVQAGADGLALVAMPALAFALVAAEPTISLVFGDEFAAAAPALPVLMAAYVMVCAGYLAGVLVIVLERQRRFLRYALLGLAANVALNVALIPRYGFMAAAWVTLATELLVNGFALRLVLGDLGLRLRLGRAARAAAAAGAMALLVGLSLQAGLPPAVCLVLAPVAYLPAAFLTRAVTVGEVRGTLGGRGGD